MTGLAGWLTNDAHAQSADRRKACSLLRIWDVVTD